MERRRVTPYRASKLIDQGWACLDVRTVREFNAQHVPSAKNVWFGEWKDELLMENPRFLQIVKANFSTGRRLVLYCHTGHERSIRAAKALRRMGFGNVVSIRGGFSAWSLRGLPTTRESAPEDTYEFLAVLAEGPEGRSGN